MQKVFIKRVVDGDTVEATATLKIRLDFIDAPEKTGKEKELGLVSLQWLKDRLEGKEVEIDVKKIDMYDRFLSVIYMDGVNVNGELVKKHLAEIYAPKLHNDGKIEE